MTLVIEGSSPLVPRTGISNQPSSTPPGLNSADVPTGGLSQGWVLTAAVQQFGALDNGTTGLQLPLPLGFAEQYPGPSEVFVRVLAMPGAAQANDLLGDQSFTGVGEQGYTDTPANAINGGLAGTIDSDANGGLSEYRFQWVSGNDWIQVNVLGASMTAQQAQAIASLAGQ
jgi:hypothetical protein